MKDRSVAAQVLSELEKQHETIMNPKASPTAAHITDLAFIWYLGANAGTGLVNLTQTPLVGIPLMGGQFGFLFHNAEAANREITALTTYRLARAEELDHKMATEQARKMVFDAHFDYSGANRPRVMKNDWMKVSASSSSTDRT